MQDIKDLSYLINENNLRPVNTAGQPFDGASKIGSFFDLLVKGKINTDEDAIKALYGPGENGAKYRKLKSDFRNRLLHALCNLSTSTDEYSKYQRAYYDCNKQWMFVKILAGQNSFNAAQYVAERLLKQSIQFEFANLSMEAASYLRIQYALREATDKKYVETNQIFKYYRKVYDAECLAEELYTLLVAQHVNSQAPKQDSIEIVEKYWQEIRGYLEEYDTYRLHLHGRLIHYFKYLFAADYKGANQVCDDAIRFFQAKPFESRVPLQIFYYQKLIGNIQMLQIEEGEKTAQLCLQYLKKGTFNWFKYQELYLKLLFHTGQYDSAMELVLEIHRHPRFQFLPENVKEIWRIYEAYINYLAAQQIVTMPSSKLTFKLGKFINETPIYARDKSGMNIVIIIIRILFMVLERKQSQLVDEAESIRQYCYNYLNTPQTQRSFLFIKMLLQIPAASFSLPEIDKRAQGYLEKLETLQLKAANQTYEIEIIPYETLWKITRASLNMSQNKAGMHAGKK